MEQASPSEQFTAGLRELAREVVDEAVRTVTTGKGRVIQDPFAGRTIERLLPPEYLPLASVLRTSKLSGDLEVAAALREALDAVVGDVLFRVCSSLDGSGPPIGDVQASLNDPSGQPISGVHESLLPIR